MLEYRVLSAEQKRVYQATIELIHDMASKDGWFAKRRAAGLYTLVQEVSAMQEEFTTFRVKEILVEMQMYLITGVVANSTLIEGYDEVVEAVKRWSERAGYERPPTRVIGRKNENMKRHVNHIMESLPSLGASEIAKHADAGYITVDFKLNESLLGKMRGAIEIRTKYDCDVRYSVAAGYASSGEMYILLSKSKLVGEIHCHKFGLAVPAEMKYQIDYSETREETDRLLAVLARIIGAYSYLDR